MDTIGRIRNFNRAYTAVIGLLDKNYLNSERTLTEIRILYEIFCGNSRARALCEKLCLDAGYVSRILKKLEGLGLVERRRSEEDSRAMELRLTGEGEEQVRILSQRSDAQIAELIRPLNDFEREKLVGAMETIEKILKL